MDTQSSISALARTLLKPISARASIGVCTVCFAIEVSAQQTKQHFCTFSSFCHFLWIDTLFCLHWLLDSNSRPSSHSLWWFPLSNWKLRVVH